MKVLVDRKLLLRDILRIESDIRKMRRDPTYVWIKHNIFSLETRRFGAHTVKIASPDDPETTLEMRNNSQKMKDTLSRYKELRIEFTDKIDVMVSRKTELQKQLFDRP